MLFYQFRFCIYNLHVLLFGRHGETKETSNLDKPHWWKAKGQEHLQNVGRATFHFSRHTLRGTE